MRRLAILLASAAMAVVGVVALAQRHHEPSGHGTFPLTDDATYVGKGPRVVVLGDSITNLAHDRIHRALDDHASAIVSISGEGFSGGPGTDSFGTDEPVMVARARRFARTSPAVAVIALGTNDAWDPALQRLDPMPPLGDVFGAFDDRTCTVAVLVAEDTTATHYDAERAKAINAELRRRADVVVDWRLHVVPGDLEPDDVHPTAQGQASFAEAVAAGVGRCPD